MWLWPCPENQFGKGLSLCHKVRISDIRPLDSSCLGQTICFDDSLISLRLEGVPSALASLAWGCDRQRQPPCGGANMSQEEEANEYPQRSAVSLPLLSKLKLPQCDKQLSRILNCAATLNRSKSWNRADSQTDALLLVPLSISSPTKRVVAGCPCHDQSVLQPNALERVSK